MAGPPCLKTANLPILSTLSRDEKRGAGGLGMVMLSCTRPGLVLDMSRTLPKCPIFTQKGPLSMDAGHLPDLTQCVLGGPDTIRSNATLLSNNLTQPVPEKPAILTMNNNLVKTLTFYYHTLFQ